MVVAAAAEGQVSSLSASSSFHGFILHHPASPILGLGLALGMSFLSTMLIPAQPPKPLSMAIKVANEALRGAKALHHLNSPESSLLFASETLVKGYKVSRSLNLIQPNKNSNSINLSTVVKTMKPCLGAISIVRYVTSPVQDFGFLGFGLLSYGYKFSKNFFKVLKGVGGFEMGVALKNGFDSLGLVVKAVKVAKELGQITGDGDHQSSRRCCFYGYGGGYRKALVGDAGYGIECAKRLSLPLDHCSSCCGVESGVGFVEEERLTGAWVPEVLCLSIPVKGGCC